MKEAILNKGPIQHYARWQTSSDELEVEELSEELIREDAPDAVLCVKAGRCSLWWSKTPIHQGRKIGYIGHYAAADRNAALCLLNGACRLLEEAGAEQAIGPMDGSTWKRYRFVTASDTTTLYFLEPTNPLSYAEHWHEGGFTTFARYFSSVSDLRTCKTARIPALEERLYNQGVSIRPLEISEFRMELKRLFKICLESFAGNLLYTPITEKDFFRQYERIRPLLIPELVLIAEYNNEPVGFAFMLPDAKNPDHHPDTVILKTLAHLPQRALRGLGELLLVKAQERARQLGFSKVIHALMHETNPSAALSRKHGSRIFREYQLFSRILNS